MQTASFTFAGRTGTATRSLSGTFVCWGGMGFQIEAAKPELRAAIDKALAESSEQQNNRRAYMAGISRNARKAQYRDL